MPDNLLTLGKLEFGIFVIGPLSDDGFEVFEGGARAEDSYVGRGSPVICLRQS